jgi:hypothetical protein
MGTGQGHTLDMAGTPSHLAVYFRVALKTVLCLRGSETGHQESGTGNNEPQTKMVNTGHHEISFSR